MLYQEYQEKLARRNARILAVWKWRYLILAVVVLLIIASVLLYFVGTVTFSECEDTVIYGDKPNISAKAFYGNVAFRYRAVGGAWSYEEPLFVGNYEAQAVSFTLSGEERYGEIHTFAIIPADLTLKVVDFELDFGSIPQDVAADNLKYGDKLIFGGFEFAYSQDTVDVAPVKGDVRIIDNDGNDVTANYNVTVQAKTLICNPISIKITTYGDSWVYDGQPHALNAATAKGLLDGHTLRDVVTISITDVGSAKNEVTSYRIFDEDSNDVTVHYHASFDLGELTVVEREITVTSIGDSWVYDGQPHSHTEGHTFDNLVNGHNVTFGAWTAIVDVGSVDNKPQSFAVTDEHGTDVTANYTLSYICGKLTVTKRVFDVRTGDKTFVHDGTGHKYLQYEVLTSSGLNEGLLDGHRVTAAASAGVTNVTDKSNQVGYADNVQTYTVVDGNGRDVSANYLPRGQWGKIRVKPTIKVRVYALSKFYDGTPLSYQATDWFVESVPVGVDASWVRVTLVGSLTEPGVLSLATARSQSKVTVVDNNGRDLLADQDDPNAVEFVGSPLTVNRRPLTVTSISVAQARNGTPLSSNLAWISVGSLLNGHSAQFKVTGTLQPDQDTAPNTVTATVLDANGNDVTKYYSITYQFGTLSWLDSIEDTPDPELRLEQDVELYATDNFICNKKRFAI
ncbi:MAG: hypothetical protein J1F66_01810 [Clostridiales bacterium]|nr:hypothetical protein [Clostridiales bacterium]